MSRPSENKGLQGPRYDEVAVDTWAFGAVAKRAGLTPTHFERDTSVARNTIRRCLLKSKSQPRTAFIKYESFQKLRDFLCAQSKEKVDLNVFIIPEVATELAAARAAIARELVREGPLSNPIAALAGEPWVHRVLCTQRRGQALYAALCNTAWRRKHSDTFWTCSWREASALVWYLRGDENAWDFSYYCSGHENEDAHLAVRCMLSHLGWFEVSRPLREHAMREALQQRGQLAEVRELAEQIKAAIEAKRAATDLPLPQRENH